MAWVTSPGAQISRIYVTASVLAHKYGVTGKAIRDVWTHKTWACATRPFWPAADDSDGAVAPAEKKKKKTRLARALGGQAAQERRGRWCIAWG